MKESKDFDYQNDWKLVTLFIGGNDLCDYCKDKSLHSPQAYINDIQEGLDILYNELPKTFVNLVTVLKVNDIGILNEGLICSLLHHFECPCAAYPENDEAKKELAQVFQEYVTNTHNLINSNRYEKDDFTVVIQPFMEGNFDLI
jgi:phospholipase B1